MSTKISLNRSYILEKCDCGKITFVEENSNEYLCSECKIFERNMEPVINSMVGFVLN